MRPARLATLLALAGACWPPLAARADDRAMAVSVVSAERHCFVNRLDASGTFQARHTVELRPDHEGLVVTDVSVAAGDTVAKDQALARLVAPQDPTQEVELKTPVPGVVVGADATVGAYTGLADPLFRIAESGDIELKAATLAKNLPHLRKGMAARIHVVGLGDVGGRIAAVDDGVDTKTQLGVLHLSIAADPRLRAGSFARAEIDAGDDCGLTIPLSALLFGPDGDVVGIVQSDRVVMRRVKTGLLEGGTIEIRYGLMENDPVIAKAGPFLREGDHVRPVTAER